MCFFKASDEANQLELLEFALSKKSIPKTSYYIGDMGDEGTLHDKVCLMRRRQGDWLVFYTERGGLSQKSCHSSLNDAAKDFFLRLAEPQSFWRFRDAWEKETGQSF